MSVSSATLPASLPLAESKEQLVEQRRKELTDYLLREGLATYRNGRLSATSRGSSTSSGKSHPSVDEAIQNAKGDICPAAIDEDDHVFDEKAADNEDDNAADSEAINDYSAGDMPAADTKTALAEVAKIILDSSSDQEAEQQDEEVSVDFEFNNEETTIQFERALLEHRNSIGSYDGEEFLVDNSQSEPFVITDLDEEADSQCADEADIQCAEEKVDEIIEGDDSQCAHGKTTDTIESNQTDPSIVCETSNVSSQMNAAFLASESQQISFESFPPGSETSGEQGYTTGKENLTSPGIDSSHNMSNHNTSTNNSDQNIEITLCSSRLEDDTTSMPQPDVSPLTEDEVDKDATAPFAVDNLQESGFQESERPPLEERVPHLHYNPPKPSHQEDVDNVVEPGSEDVPDEEPEIIAEPVAPRDINVRPISVGHDVETDDDFLFDDDSQADENDVDQEAVDEIDHHPGGFAETTTPCLLTEPQPAVDALTTEEVSEELPVVKTEKQFRARLARRRWFDCCSLL